MAENTKIEWATHTMNFWTGCQAVSRACDNCYAEVWAKRAGRDFSERVRTTEANWGKPHKWNRAAIVAARRDQVFTNSLADFFDNQVPPSWRADAIDTIRDCQWLDWLILTKRPQNVMKMWPELNAANFPQVWIGASAGDRVEMERNVRHIQAIPSAIRFLSLEPLLEDLGTIDLSGIHLAIVGGESGPNARPMDLEWARAIRDQCAAAGVACFVKQLGARPHSVPDRISHRGDRSPKPDGFYRRLKDRKGGDMAEWPEDLRVRQMPGGS